MTCRDLHVLCCGLGGEVEFGRVGDVGEHMYNNASNNRSLIIFFKGDDEVERLRLNIGRITGLLHLLL